MHWESYSNHQRYLKSRQQQYRDPKPYLSPELTELAHKNRKNQRNNCPSDWFAPTTRRIVEDEPKRRDQDKNCLHDPTHSLLAVLVYDLSVRIMALVTQAAV